MRGFCERHGLSEAQFWWWKRRLKELGRTAPVEARPAFVPVTIVERSARAADDASIDIHLSGRRRLRVRSGCDRRLLADIIAMLEDKSC